MLNKALLTASLVITLQLAPFTMAEAKFNIGKWMKRGVQISTQQLSQLKYQGQLLQQQLKQQLDLKQITENSFMQLQQQLMGNYGYGNFLLDGVGADVRNWGANNIGELLQGKGDDEMRELAQYFNNRYPQLNEEEIGDLPQPHLVSGYHDNVAVSNTNLAAAATAYNRLQRHSSLLEELARQIDSAPNLKAAMDLNNRIGVQIALLEVEMLKLQSLQLYGDGNNNRQQANWQAAAFKFNQW